MLVSFRDEKNTLWYPASSSPTGSPKVIFSFSNELKRKESPFPGPITVLDKKCVFLDDWTKAYNGTMVNFSITSPQPMQPIPKNSHADKIKLDTDNQQQIWSLGPTNTGTEDPNAHTDESSNTSIQAYKWQQEELRRKQMRENTLW